MRRALYFQELFSLNVIYIVAHDFGRDLGCYGRPVETPNIDRLAGESFRFTHAHTSAVCCSPSRACAMSGLYPHRNGVMGLSHLGWPMPAATRTLVDWLNEAGVETAHCGFQHERDEPTQNRYAVEFTETREDHLVQNAVDQAITYLKRGRNTNKPFYLNVGTLEAHSSAWKPSPDPPAAERFKLRQYERYEPYVDGLEPVAGDGHAYPRRYRAALRFFDHHVGRLLDAVEQLGLKESTAIVLTTDHGAGFGSRRKNTLYTGGTETALLIRPPEGLDRPQLVADLTPNVDLAPTVAEALGVQPPHGLDGRSLWPRLTGGVCPSREELLGFLTYHGAPIDQTVPYFRRSMRTSDRLLIWKPPVAEHDEQWAELYDAVNDPHCLHDLADAPEHRAEARAMRNHLRQVLTDSGDPVAQGVVPRSAQQLCLAR